MIEACVCVVSCEMPASCAARRKGLGPQGCNGSLHSQLLPYGNTVPQPVFAPPQVRPRAACACILADCAHPLALFLPGKSRVGCVKSAIPTAAECPRGSFDSPERGSKGPRVRSGLGRTVRPGRAEISIFGGSARRNRCVLLVIFDPTDAKYPRILRTFNIRKPGKEIGGIIGRGLMFLFLF